MYNRAEPIKLVRMLMRRTGAKVALVITEEDYRLTYSVRDKYGKTAGHQQVFTEREWYELPYRIEYYIHAAMESLTKTVKANHEMYQSIQLSTVESPIYPVVPPEEYEQFVNRVTEEKPVPRRFSGFLSADDKVGE